MASRETHLGLLSCVVVASLADFAAASPGFERAQHRRIDVVMIGDSNQLFGGHGWDESFQIALAERYGVYGTGLHSLGENGGNGAAVGLNASTFSTLSQGGYLYAGAPQASDALLPAAAACVPLNYAFIPVGSTTTTNLGMFLQSGPALNVDGPLRGFLATAGSTEFTGTFRISFRREAPPFNTLVQSGPLTTSGPAGSVIWHELDLPAGTRGSVISLRTPGFATPLSGPFMGLYARVIDTSRDRGVSVHTLYGRGSQSLRSMAAAMQGMQTTGLGEFLDAIVRQQGESTPHVIVRINSGLNDRNETLASLGPANVQDGDSAEAFADNAVAIITALQQAWTSKGLPLEGLRFVLTSSHPISMPNDAELASYAAALPGVASRFAPGLVTAVALEELISADAMLSRGYYTNPGDRFHLSRAGFLALTQLEVEAVMGCDTIDFNNNAVFPEDQDVIDFFNVLAGVECPLCSDIDFNNNGVFPEDQDVIDFLHVLAGGAC